jgi:hypothetical protein
VDGRRRRDPRRLIAFSKARRPRLGVALCKTSFAVGQARRPRLGVVLCRTSLAFDKARRPRLGVALCRTSLDARRPVFALGCANSLAASASPLARLADPVSGSPCARPRSPLAKLVDPVSGSSCARPRSTPDARCSPWMRQLVGGQRSAFGQARRPRLGVASCKTPLDTRRPVFAPGCANSLATSGSRLAKLADPVSGSSCARPHVAPRSVETPR